MATLTVPDDVRSLMSPGERVIWVDRPFLWDIDAKNIANLLISVIWVIASLGILLNWWSIPFLWNNKLIALGWLLMGTGLPAWSLYQRSQTTYVLTDQRIAIHRDGFWSATFSYDLKSISNLTLEKQISGRGSISLTGSPTILGNVKESDFDAARDAVLSGVRGAAQVYELIIATREKSAVHEMPVWTERPVERRR